MENDHFIYAYHFSPEGHVRLPIEDSELKLESKGGYNWLHMAAMHPSTREYLENHTDIEPIIIDSMLAEETRPRALVKDKGILIILRAMNLNPGQDPSDMISIRLWVDNEKVISTRRRDIKAIDDIIEFISIGKIPSGAGDFLIMITDRLFDRMEPFIVDLEEYISKSEELLAVGKEQEISTYAALVRKRTTIFIRYIVPQKALLETLIKTDIEWLKEEHKEHLVESLDKVTRYIEELYELRARSQILNDELDNMHSRRLNDITYIFSVAATLFLPLSFLTGLMGINMGGMPGVDNDLAFWLFASLCVVISAVQVALFKKFKWF